MPERRDDPRNICFLRAEAVLDNGTRRFPCEAHDISSQGMRLTGAEIDELPDSFIIDIPRRNVSERVDVVRRCPQEIGVRFQNFKL